MPLLQSQLDLPRCPHCQVDKPHLSLLWSVTTNNYSGRQHRFWATYRCARCGGVTLGASTNQNGESIALYPSPETMEDEAVPANARTYLNQALDSRHAPAGAVMLAASAVDSMLKAKGYKEGSLDSRIKKAVADHLITKEMGQWAHEVRLDANEQRHADENYEIPDETDAHRVIEFTKALALFLFVLPKMVTRGIEEAKSPPSL